MSYIQNSESYKSFPHVFLITKDFNIIDIGVYNPSWDVVSDSYVSGRLVDMKGEKYPDEKYQGKNCTILRFEHYPLGNYPILYKIGKSHLHSKVLVSTNEIELDSVKIVDRDRNVFYFANLKAKPFVVEGGEYVLYEVEPHLTPDELERIRCDTNTVAEMKNKMVEAVKSRRKAEAELLVTNASLVGAELHIKTLESYIEQYGVALDELSEKAIQLGFSKAEIVSKSIKDIESKFDLQLNWRESLRNKLIDDTDSKAKSISKFFANIELYKSDKNLTDTMKEYIVDVVVDICGADYVQAQLHRIRDKGLTRDRTDSLLGNNLRVMESEARGFMNSETANSLIENAVRTVYNTFQQNGGNMQDAINSANHLYPHLSKQTIEDEINQRMNRR